MAVEVWRVLHEAGYVPPAAPLEIHRETRPRTDGTEVTRIELDPDAGPLPAGGPGELAREVAEVDPGGTLREQVQQAAADALPTLRTIRDAPHPLTDAQRDNAISELARVLTGVVRLVARRLDDTG